MTDFDDIYRQHLSAVFRYAIKCVWRREVAEEIHQRGIYLVVSGPG